MNKLHIILGYLQTGESQKAVQFIMNTSLVTSQSIRETADCIRVSHLCALIIGKMMHAAELGILLTVTHDSFCREEDLLLSPEDYATILGNLLENAIDELSRSHSEVREIKLSMYCRPDCNLVVCEDTGGGIAPDILPHIWDKGFSSKGEGRGFGLYLISRLVDEHGGCIELETEPGVGTCFTLTFTREECDRMYQVIIIEDDPMVAAIDKQYVEADSQFRVVRTFKSGGEALAHLPKLKADLIILDYYTPGMNGTEFVDQLHTLGESPFIIAVTSANDTHIVQGLLARGVLDYLVKPFQFPRFRQALDRFLQARRLLEQGPAAWTRAPLTSWSITGRHCLPVRPWTRA